jgi:hypothetical protein
MLEFVFSIFFTFASGSTDRHQEYHFPTKADCDTKEAERRAWADIQQRDGIVKGYSVVTCHPQEAAVSVGTPGPRRPLHPTEPWKEGQ